MKLCVFKLAVATHCCIEREFAVVVQERRKKEREVEEKRLAAERAAEDERRKTAEVTLHCSISPR